MLIRCEMKYNEAFVSAFEDWLQDSYPDDHWLLDKVFHHTGSLLSLSTGRWGRHKVTIDRVIECKQDW